MIQKHTDYTWMNFDKLYIEKFCGNHTADIGCSYKVWQNAVLTSLLLHRHVSDVIDIRYIWSYVEQQMDLQGVTYRTEMMSEFDIGYMNDGDGLSLHASVVEYLKRLCENGYLIDTGERMGHDDEYRFRLSAKIKYPYYTNIF